MKLSGFLAPDGAFTECPSWSHTYEAEKICKEKFNKEFYSGIEAEDFLYEQGYVGFYARNASHRFIVNGNIILLTDKQLDFIINNIDKANNDDQRKDIEDLLRYNEDYSEHSIIQHYEKKIII